MIITHVQFRDLFKKFWEKKSHVEVPPIPLVPKDDSTTLFTGFGMQQLVPYLLGEPHPLGKKLYNIQPCFRAQDIEEVGDNRHTTFFEMLGNWSLGAYFKEEQLKWCWDFFTNELSLPKEKLYISVFAGTKTIARDEESASIWKKLGVPEEKIFYYGVDKNWWSRAGVPENMPAGEPGGPDSEIFYDFGEELGFHEKSQWRNHKCHPNCDCGRFLEIGNSVFMQYKKNSDGSFSDLPNKNVDFGGGLERILAAVNNDPDVFKTDIFSTIISEIERRSAKKYANSTTQSSFRIIADHLKAASFIAKEGIEPSNKERGYVLRRLIRRCAVKMMQLDMNPEKDIPYICKTIIKNYQDVYFQKKDIVDLHILIGEEAMSFLSTMNRGVKFLQNSGEINGKLLFDLKQNYGFPLEIALELLKEWKILINEDKIKNEFHDQFIKHQQFSRKSSAGKFKGGLADHSDQVLKYHTATHLLHQALFDVMGTDVRQEGSNITSERLRFDFYSPQKPETPQINKVLEIINSKIKESLPVSFKIIPKGEALKIGAKAFFREKYGDMVKVYFIGNYSKELCGGPHVKNTQEIGKVEIYKFEKIGSNLYRIYAK